MGVRKPASEVSTMKVMRDFECPKCKKIWEDRVSEQDMKDGFPKCSECGEQGVKQFPAPGIDTHAARSWRM